MEIQLANCKGVRIIENEFEFENEIGIQNVK